MKIPHHLSLLFILIFSPALHAANWKYCDKLVTKLAVVAKEKKYSDLNTSFQNLRSLLKSANGTNWKRLAELEFRLNRLFADSTQNALFPSHDLKSLIADIEHIRRGSTPHILERLNDPESRKGMSAIESIALASFHSSTATRAAPAFLHLLNHPSPIAQSIALQYFWPVFKEIVQRSSHNRAYTALITRFSDAIPRAIELWILKLLDENISEVVNLEVRKKDWGLARELERLNSILENNETYLSFSQAKIVIESIIDYHRSFNSESEELFKQDFVFSLSQKSFEPDIFDGIVREERPLIFYSGEFLLAAQNPKIDRKTRRNLQTIASFLVEKLHFLLIHGMFDEKQEAEEILSRLPFKISRINAAKFPARIVDNDSGVIVDISTWLKNTRSSYEEIEDLKGNNLHTIARLTGNTKLANQLEEKFVKK